MRRIGVMVLVGVLSLGVLTGCSPAIRGLSGLRLDENGQLVAVLAWCKDFGTLTTIELSEVGSSGRYGDEVLRLERTGEVTGRYLEIALSSPPLGWKADKAMPPLDDLSQSYELRAWSEEGYNRVHSFPFRIGEFQVGEIRGRRHEVGDILTKEEKYPDGYRSAWLTPETFRQRNEQECA